MRRPAFHGRAVRSQDRSGRSEILSAIGAGTMIRQLRSAPNLLTLLRLIFIPFIVIAVVENHYGSALAIFIAAGLTDWLDGLLARALKHKTLPCPYLDPIPLHI